ncbi:MAG: 2-oxo acid dehydrogenase subunit E2 [Pseudomonadota bacterium]
MTRTIEIRVPDIGDFKNIPVIELPVKPGDVVTEEQTIIVLESDKATLDVPSPAAGRVSEIRLSLGDAVSEGSLVALLEIEPADEADDPAGIPVSPAPPPTPSEPPAPHIAAAAPPAPPAVTAAQPPRAASSTGAPPHASPSVRRLARILGVDLSLVTGTGPKGRIVAEDLHGFVQSALSAAPSAGTGLDLLPWPKVDFSKFGAVERAPLSRIKRVSGANLARNSVIIPHVTNFAEADVTELESFRTRINAEASGETARLTMLAFMIKAAVATLRKHPLFNASLDGEELVLKQYFHIGFAADTPNGLVVPVIRDADQKGLVALAGEAAGLAAKARDGKLKPDEMQGGCFTVSSLGGIGGTGFTPIINAPEVAILGAARAEMKPVWDGAAFVPRLVMPISLSWDHRVVDGAEAARFLMTFTGLLAEFRRISL